jgi:hypothetical protein
MLTRTHSPQAGNRAGLLTAAIIVGALLVIGIAGFRYLMPGGTMLILRGIASAESPRGQLDDESARLYALRSGYGGKVLDVAGGTAEQMQMALEEIRGDPRVRALYGFSGGAYASAKIWAQLSEEERARIRKVVIVGAPGITRASFPGAQEVVIQADPPEGHMEGPRVLLQSER